MTINKFPGRAASALAAVALCLAAFAAPASARDTYVVDNAKLLSAATVSSLNQSIGDFNRQTGKEVVVVSVPSLDGQTAPVATEKAFAEQQVNGVLIFLAKAEQKQGILGDRASRAFFPNGSFDSVRQAMRGYFRTGDFDTGVTTGVNLILNQYRGHERAGNGALQPQRTSAPATSSQSFGGGMSLFFLIIVLLAGFMIIRGIFRAMSGPRRMPPGYGGPGYPGQGPGYGAPGYGGGMGGGMGGGGFFSGLLGGLGGAFLGNELFGHQNQGNIGGGNAGIVGGDAGSQDAGGWQSDAGQADMGNASFGDFGSSGGGFDSGGGGGFDGGGGGDSGGGW
ncbi:MAG: TPM domain-containing protein [Candidatus Eremiobacteraeota bacterium]|nr:TPM domain-containing protein [Candidatus Eremiobacteraeota bacterium]